MTVQVRERLGTADIVVIGAGIMGASIAFQLTRQSGRRVAVVDERPPVGGMSGRTFGQIRQHYSNALMVEMAIRGFEVLNNWETEVGVGDPGYVKLGYLLLVVEAQVEACRRNVDLGRQLGVDTRFASPDEIKALEPALVTDDLAGGAWEPNGGYIDVTRMVLSWLGAAQAAGATLHSGLRVEAIATSDGRVVGVDTAEGRIEAPVVVCAAGAWSSDLLAPIGVDAPIERRRLDMAYLEQPPGRPTIRTCITDGNSNVVMRPDMGSYLLAVAYPNEMPQVADAAAPRAGGGRGAPPDAPRQGAGRAAAGLHGREGGTHGLRRLRHHAGLSSDPRLGAGAGGALSRGRFLRPRAQALARGGGMRRRCRAGVGIAVRHPPAQAVPLRRRRAYVPRLRPLRPRLSAHCRFGRGGRQCPASEVHMAKAVARMMRRKTGPVTSNITENLCSVHLGDIFAWHAFCAFATGGNHDPYSSHRHVSQDRSCGRPSPFPDSRILG